MAGCADDLSAVTQSEAADAIGFPAKHPRHRPPHRNAEAVVEGADCVANGNGFNGPTIDEGSGGKALVHHNEAEVIAGPAGAPLLAHQRLHTGHDHRGVEAGM